MHFTIFFRQSRLLNSVICKTVRTFFILLCFTMSNCKIKIQNDLQCKTCKTLTYELFEFINSNSICFIMLDATYNDPDVEIVEEENGVPSIIVLILSMIEKGNVTRTDQIHYFVEHFGSSNSKTRLILQDNLIALIAALALDAVSTGQSGAQRHGFLS